MLRCIFITMLLGILLGAPPSNRNLAADEPPRQATDTVHLVIDYGDGVQKHFTRLPWKADMTVIDALHAAAEHPRGIKFQSRGRGATAFVWELDKLQNEPNGRAWLYRVNGKLADRSGGVFPLKAGDTVLWSFERYR